MPITVVGSIAFDDVTTPFGSRARLLGGAATHFALAASFFDTVHVVGCVGDDFTDQDLVQVATRGTRVDGVERINGGKTFTWRGEYGWDTDSRETLETNLNVFGSFAPTLSPAARTSDVLFLANIHPQLQLQVLELCQGPELVALDSMNLWIETERDALVEVIQRVNCVILSDGELRQLTARPNVLSAALEVLSWGPSIVVAKQGASGAALITGSSYFALPTFPIEKVVDPTGAGDTFAGGFIGCLAPHLDRLSADDALRRAMAYGTALAAFNVEEFGTLRVVPLKAEELEARVAHLSRLTQIEHEPIELVA
jgi:sugar/nucleoside kinase (ribokinase family)